MNLELKQDTKCMVALQKKVSIHQWLTVISRNLAEPQGTRVRVQVWQLNKNNQCKKTQRFFKSETTKHTVERQPVQLRTKTEKCTGVSANSNERKIHQEYNRDAVCSRL